MSNLERNLKLSSRVSAKETGSDKVARQRRYFSEKLQPYVLMGSLAALAAPALTGCGENDSTALENIGVVQQNVWSGDNSPLWGQQGPGINLSPSIYPETGLNRTAVFEYFDDLYCSTTTDGGSSWSPEQLIGVSNGDSYGVTICAGNVECPTPKLVYSLDHVQGMKVFTADFNLATCQASNVTEIGQELFLPNSYPSAHQATGNVYLIQGTTVRYTSPNTFNPQNVTLGTSFTALGGVAVWSNCDYGNSGTCIMISAPDCPNPRGGLDLCMAEFNENTKSVVGSFANVADVSGNDPTLSDANDQATPFVGAEQLCFDDNDQIRCVDTVGQGGSGGAGGAGGTGGSGGSTGGSGGMGGSTGGAGGMGGSPSGGAGGMGGMETGGAGGQGGAGGAGAGGMETGGSGGTGGSGYECPVTFTGTGCDVTECDGGNIGMTLDNANCTLNYQPAGYDVPLSIGIRNNGPDTMLITGENGGTLFLAYGIDPTLDHPQGAAELNVEYVADNGSDVALGLLGTKYACISLPKDNEYNIEKGLACSVDEGAIMVSLNTIPYQALDFGQGEGVVPLGESFVLSLTDASLITSSAEKPDGGPNITPPADDGCSVCAVGLESTQKDTNNQAMAVLLGLAALTVARRRKRKEA